MTTPADLRPLDPFDLVLERLRVNGCRVRVRSKDSARAQCPAHADGNPSLLVTRMPNRVVLKCFAGCQKLQVLNALGLRYADTYFEPRTTPEKAIVVARYPYTDVAGTVIAEKVRTDRKQFFWCMPDGRRGLHGCSVDLFNLAELVDARQVVKVEGEKAVERLRALGFAATCGPSGAAQWRDEWARMLWHLGCEEIAILPDNDQAGRRHARAVAASCFGCVGSPQSHEGDEAAPWASWPSGRPTDAELTPMRVKLVTLPNIVAGGDIVDYLDGGHDADDLRQLIARCPYWHPGLDDEQHLARRRELGRIRAQRKRAKDRAAQNARNAAYVSEPARSVPGPCGRRVQLKGAPACNAAYVSGRVTRHAVTLPNVRLYDSTKNSNQERPAA